MKFLLLFLFLSLPAFSQTAKVIQLTPDEARQAKDLYDQEQALKQKRADFDDAIRKKHIFDNPEKYKGLYYAPGFPPLKEGWTREFEYSEDFKFIVPQRFISSGSMNWNNCGTFTVAPVAYSNEGSRIR